jgi:hypothetical protein
MRRGATGWARLHFVFFLLTGDAKDFALADDYCSINYNKFS